MVPTLIPYASRRSGQISTFFAVASQDSTCRSGQGSGSGDLQDRRPCSAPARPAIVAAPCACCDTCSTKAGRCSPSTPDPEPLSNCEVPGCMLAGLKSGIGPSGERANAPAECDLRTINEQTDLRACTVDQEKARYMHVQALVALSSDPVASFEMIACHQRLHHNDESTSSSVAHDAAQSNAVPHAESIHVEQAAKWWNALEPRNLRTSGRDDSRSRRHRKYAQLRQALLDAGVLEAGVPVNDAGLTAQST